MGIVDAIFGVFSAIAGFIAEMMPTVEALFWAEGALTVLGSLSVISLGIGIFFLLVGVITNFVKFRS